MAVRTITTKLAVDGEQAYKQSLKSVNSELGVLKSEMQATDAEFKGQANSAEALTAKHRILADEVAQQQIKVNSLAEAVEEASKTYGEADSRTDSYRIQLNNARAALVKMNDALEANDEYLDEARTSVDGCASSIDEFGREVKDAGDETLSLGMLVKANLASDAIKAGIKGFGQALTALPAATVKALSEGVKELISGVTELAETAGDLDDTAKRVGMTAEAYQEWVYAAKLGGMETSKLESLMIKQQKSFSDAAEGAKTTAEAYKRLGIDINEVSDSSEAFEQVIYALAEMEDATTRNALANDIFGKSYADLAPLLAEGADGIAAWRQEVVDLGGVISNEAVEAGASFGDSLDRLQTRFDGLKNNLSGDFLPAFTRIVDGMTELLGGNAEKGVLYIKNGMQKISNELDELGPAAEDALDAMLEIFVDMFPDLVDTGGNLILKLVEGMGGNAPKIIDAAADAIIILTEKLLAPESLETIKEAGLEIGEALLAGIGKVLSNWAGHIWDDITSFVDSNPYADNADPIYRSGTNGSHAGGLSRVPYDGYVAELHRNEMVLTSRQADEYRSGETGAAPQVIEVHTHVDLDGREVGRSVTRYQDDEGRARGK